MKNISKAIWTVVPYLIIIFLGYLASNNMDAFFLGQYQNIIFYAPYVILILASVLAWKFNRSRSFFMALICMMSLYLQYYQENMQPIWNDTYIILSILLPLNILALAFIKERGILSFWGMLRFGFILLQAGWIYWVITEQQDILVMLKMSIFPFRLKPFITVSHVAFLVILASIIILILRYILYLSSQDLTFLSVLFAAFLMLNKNNSMDYSIFYAVIGVILILSILKDSYFMAFFDELTGLPSRRALNQDLMKLGMKYSIAMLDIDHFKKFNDTYGHDTGDEVLKFIGSIIKNVKGGGKVYRYGGEEFTILFPGKNTNDVLSVLEDLREAVAKRAFVVRKKRPANSSSKNSSNQKSKNRRTDSNNTKKIYIHVSIGVAHKDETSKTPDIVIKAADTALYRAKKKGRNCVSK